MKTALSIYWAGVILTAVHIWRINRPREAGGWIGFAAFVLGWPVLFGWLAVDTISGKLRNRGK